MHLAHRRGRGRLAAGAEFVARLPADQRPGDGQGHRGHGVLPLQPPRRAERGRRRPGPVRRAAGAFHARHARRSTLAARMTTLVHPRHQAQRGRPGAAGAARRRCPTSWAAAVRRWPARAAARGRRGRTRRRVPAVPDAGRRLAARRRPAARLRREGDARGQAAHVVDRPRRRYEARGAGLRRRACSPTTGVRRRRSTRSSPRSSSRAGCNVARAEAAAADAARRARRVPGQRAVDLSLVDPDNRRPVDYARAAARLARARRRRRRGVGLAGRASC